MQSSEQHMGLPNASCIFLVPCIRDACVPPAAAWATKLPLDPKMQATAHVAPSRPLAAWSRPVARRRSRGLGGRAPEWLRARGPRRWHSPPCRGPGPGVEAKVARNRRAQHLAQAATQAGSPGRSVHTEEPRDSDAARTLPLSGSPSRRRVVWTSVPAGS